MSNYQHQSTPASPSSLTQTELYSTYAARFSSLPSESNPPPTEDAGELRDFEANMSTPAPDLDMSFSSDPPVPKPNRLLNPVELITLARMTFPKCEPIVDGDGRFVIRGLERREAVERGRSERTTEMFPFALSSGELCMFCSARVLAETTL